MRLRANQSSSSETLHPEFAVLKMPIFSTTHVLSFQTSFDGSNSPQTSVRIPSRLSGAPWKLATRNSADLTALN